MTEIEFERKIVELAHMFDWMVASFRPAQTGKGWRTPVKYDGKGYPDLTLMHPNGQIIFAEIKAQKGRMSDDQKAWGQMIHAAGRCKASRAVQYHVWRPSDWDKIVRLLSGGKVASIAG